MPSYRKISSPPTRRKSSLPPLIVYISCAREDEKSKTGIVQALQKSGDRYDIVSDEMLTGKGISNVTGARLRNEAEVFLLLVSAAWLSSEPVMSLELLEILKQAEKRQAAVIPIILERCEWKGKPFAKYHVVPRSGKPINEYANVGEVYREVVRALQSLDEVRLNPEAKSRIAMCKRAQQSDLDLSQLGLRRIPRDMLQMPWLTGLNLAGNFIDAIENLEGMRRLKRLSLAFNQVTEISGLGGLKQLSELYLDNNFISEIKNLKGVSKLRLLNLSQNKLQSLRGVEHLQHLKALLADGNELTEAKVPAPMPALECISLIGNRISSLRSLLPQVIQGLPVDIQTTLIEGAPPGIFLSGNPISDPPPECVSDGTAAILDHFKKIDHLGQKELQVLKLILIGNSGVGKTNFSQFLRGQPVSREHISTDTLEIQNLTMPISINGVQKDIRINIFDFGGQDYYHDLHRLYYSHDTAYTLLWDKNSNRYSEQTETLADRTELIYEDFPLEYWLESIRYNLESKQATPREGSLVPEAAELKQEEQFRPAEAATDVQVAATPDLSITAPVLVLQNKIDLGGGLLNQISLYEKYPNISGFFSVSLGTGKRLPVLHDVLRDCLEKLDLAGRTLVPYVHDAIEQYLDVAPDFEVLSLEDFKYKCAELVPAHRHQFDLKDAKTIAGILTNLGVMYYDESAPDKGIVFTQVGGLNERIKRIMSVAKGGRDKGIFLKEQVKDIPHFDQILPLLLRNQSVLQLDKEQFLVPQFLSVRPDERTAGFVPAFKHCQIRYVYTAYFHKTLLVGMFARFLRRADQTPEDDSDIVKVVSYWRNGLILSRAGGDAAEMVLVHFIKEPDTCRIEIRSLHPFGAQGLEREVEKELDLINKNWTVRKEVSVNSEDFFDVEAMIAQVGNKDFEFRTGERVFTVNDFKRLVSFEKVPKKLFISYSSKDAEFVKRFWTHLNVLKAKGDIEPWYDRKIEPGTKWDDSIRKEMECSDLVVFLLSPDFLATPYIMDVELKNAIEMEKQGLCKFFFVQLLHCSWLDTGLAPYQALLTPSDPAKRMPFISTPNNDEGWNTYMESLKEKVQN